MLVKPGNGVTIRDESSSHVTPEEPGRSGDDDAHAHSLVDFRPS